MVGLPKMITITELAEAFKTTKKNVHSWIAQGLPSYKIGGRRLFDEDEIKEWIKTYKSEDNEGQTKGQTRKKIVADKRADKETPTGLISIIENDSFLSDKIKVALFDFIAMRKQIKKPLTQKGYELLFRKLTELSTNELEQIEILENSIMNCWQGIFPLKSRISTKEDHLNIKPEFNEYEEFCRTQGIRAGKIKV